MAYLTKIPVHKCSTCGRKATHELINRFNSHVEYCCETCGKRRLRVFGGEEEKKHG